MESELLWVMMKAKTPDRRLLYSLDQRQKWLRINTGEKGESKFKLSFTEEPGELGDCTDEENGG